MAVAYTWRSMVDTFHAQRQIRQNRQPPGLMAVCVNVPLHFSQAQTPSFTWAIAMARSNIHSNDIASTMAVPCEPGRYSVVNVQVGWRAANRGHTSSVEGVVLLKLSSSGVLACL
jgi:hypothetical protein